MSPINNVGNANNNKDQCKTAKDASNNCRNIIVIVIIIWYKRGGYS